MKIIKAVMIGAIVSTTSIATARDETPTGGSSVELSALVPEGVKMALVPLGKLVASNNLTVKLQVEERTGENGQGGTQLWSYKRLDSGLTSLFKQSVSSEAADSILTACGLIDIVTARQTRMSRVVGIPIPIIESSNTDSIRKYIGLSTDIVAICQPQVDSAFVIEGTVGLEMNLNGTGGARTINRQLGEKTSCHVGATTSPASTLSPELTGDYLPMSCETSWSTLPPRHSEFAFLKDFGFYFPLAREVSPTTRSFFTIKSVDLIDK